MKLSKSACIAISGITWFIVGIGLLTLGLNFILYQVQAAASSSFLLAKISQIAGSKEQGALALIATGLILGFIKGRFVLIKTVKRVSERILSSSAPIKLSELYSRGYLFLVGGMIFLGMSMKWIGLPLEIRGMIDIAVGSALMNGATAFFRIALHARKETYL